MKADFVILKVSRLTVTYFKYQGLSNRAYSQTDRHTHRHTD